MCAFILCVCLKLAHLHAHTRELAASAVNTCSLLVLSSLSWVTRSSRVCCRYGLWCRVLGHVAFRNRLLARYGTVVAIPYNPGTSNVESMAVDIKAAVEAQAGLSLNSFS